MSTIKRTSLLLTLGILTLIGVGYYTFDNTSAKPLPIELIAIMRPQAKALENFNLTDHRQQPFTLEQLKGKNTLLFFGYTSCPDICPTTLVSLNLIYQQLQEKVKDFDYQVVFVSVDPQRDTATQLAGYMKFFNPEFTAVTGDKSSIDQFSQQLGAGYIIEEPSGENEYLVSHTSSIFLIDTDTNYIASISPPHHADVIVDQLMLIQQSF